MNFLSDLKNIEKESIVLGNIIRFEGKVLRAELEERLSLGLTGDVAIEHYNSYMRRFGLVHLMVV